MSLLSASLVLGNAISFFLTGWFFRVAETEAEIKAALQTTMITQTSLVCFSFVFFQTTFREKPDYPPSAVAIEPVQNLNLRIGLKEICTNKSLLLLTIAFSSYIGLYFSLGNIISSLFTPLGFSPMQIALFALTMLSSGVVGAALTGCFLDRKAQYKKLLIFLMIVTFFTFGLVAHQVMTMKSFSIINIYMLILGMAMISVLPTSLGLGIELTFPLQPALVNGVMLMFAQIMGFVQSIVYSVMMDVDPTDYST